jgi:hypothetical protein
MSRKKFVSQPPTPPPPPKQCKKFIQSTSLRTTTTPRTPGAAYIKHKGPAAVHVCAMVWFQCEDCGDTLKKPKVKGHSGSCSASRFSCIDCLQVFDKWSVQNHTSCVTVGLHSLRVSDWLHRLAVIKWSFLSYALLGLPPLPGVSAWLHGPYRLSSIEPRFDAQQYNVVKTGNPTLRSTRSTRCPSPRRATST